MKLLLTLFLISYTESKSITKFKHTSYLYNSTQCNNSVSTIIEFVNYDYCDITKINKCINTKNDSLFTTCDVEPVIYNVKESVILTILLMLVVFLLYKMCCESELDNLCLTIKIKLEDLFCCYNDETHIQDYSSL